MNVFNHSNCPSELGESASQPHLTPPSKVLAQDTGREHTRALPETLNQWAANVETMAHVASVKGRSAFIPANLNQLYALQTLSPVEEERQVQDGCLRQEVLLTQPFEHLGHFADPLSPLRERDLVALAELFQRSDMYRIEADVNQMLLQLLPEPCWDENAFDFLREFL